MEILFTPKKLILEVEHVKELSKVYLNIQYKWWNIFLDNILGIKMRLNCKLLLLQCKIPILTIGQRDWEVSIPKRSQFNS